MKSSFLHLRAEACLQQATYPPKKLVLIHTAVALGSSFLLSLVVYALDLKIAESGGLSGLSSRTLLATVQSILELIVAVGLPFWQLGIWFVALNWVKEDPARPVDLLQGFRCFGPAVGMRFLRGGLFAVLGIAVSYVATIVFLLMPFSEPYLALMESSLGGASSYEQLEALFTPELLDSMSQALTPLLILCGALFVLLAVPVYYRLRFAELGVMDGLRAFAALRKSNFITHKKCLQIFKLDLSFWWFYLLQGICMLLCYGPILLSTLGVSVSFSGAAADFLFLALGYGCQTLLLWCFEGRRVAAYTLAYRTLDGTLNSDTAHTES